MLFMLGSNLRGFRCPTWIADEELTQTALYFQECFPQEGVVYITDRGMFPVTNIADRPDRQFAVSDNDWVAHGKVRAIIHSHVPHTDDEGGPVLALAEPTSSDIEFQYRSGVPWAIMTTDGEHTGAPIWFGDQLSIAPIYGRPFLHGIFDCYSLIRDVYRMGRENLRIMEDVTPDQVIYDWPHPPITLMEQPRDNGWWDTDVHDLYMRDFTKGGFEVVEQLHPRKPIVEVGDCFLFRLPRSKVTNHAGVYVGNGLILHHVSGYVSQRAPLNHWGPGAVCWLRYKGA